MHGQENKNPEVILNGLIKSADSDNPLSLIMIVNKRKGNGIFADANGHFNLNILKNDTILINAFGYQTKKYCFRDSALQKEYHPIMYLQKLHLQLQEIEIFPQREISEIEKDIQKLHYDKNDYMLSGTNALNSPITFLYESFSKRERGKRLAAELRNEDQKRALLKELLTKYVDGNIIKLSSSEFDRFIDFCRVSEERMKSSTQYEFIMYIKERFQIYSSYDK